MPSQCQQKAAKNNLVFMNTGTEGSCGHSSLILRRSYPVREPEKKECENERMSEKRSREMSRSICTEQFFFSLNFEK